MKCLVVFVVIALYHVQSARILGVYPLPAYSHHQVGNAIFKELAKRGHDVTVISPYKEKNPPLNFKQILVKDLIERSQKYKSTLFDEANNNIFQQIIGADAVGIIFTEWTLSHPNVQKLLQDNHQFDLVIFHQFMSDAYNGFCYHFNAPCVAISSTTAPGWVNRKVGNPGPPSYVTQLFVNSPAQMNFFERFYNSLAYVLTEASHYLYLRPIQNQLLQKYFPNVPHLDDLYYNISLILINTHVSISDVAPSLPNLIHIAGSHVKEPQPLPPDLQEYLDAATDGVIFFSMGSNLKSKDLTPSKRDAILRVFSKLKQKILWKWEDDTLINKPENVKIGSWLPQQDILAHPNVVLFITHGGMMSTIEAVHRGVPVLGIPVFSDQGLNMIHAKLRGYGNYIFYKDFTEEAFSNALNDMLTTDSYKKNVKRRSNVMKDQVVKPLDNAVFWIEYVLRHRGAPHLRSSALSLSWYQYHLLDVIASFVIILILMIVVVRAIFRKIWHFFCVKKHNEKKKKH